MENALTLSRPRPLLRDVALRAGGLWRAYPRETLGLGLFALIAAAAIAMTSLSTPDPHQHAAPPAPPPMVVRPLAPDQALKLNAEIPVTLGRTALRPLDSFTCPAVVVEISPLSGKTHVTALSDPAYQDRIVAALAEAVEQWQRDWRQP